MHKFHVLLASVATLLVASVSTLPATAVPSPAGRLVSEVAASGTPHVLDGRVFSVTQVGSTMLLGGTFASARNDSSQTALPRANLLAFNAQSGQISTTFLPNPNGAVQKIVDAGDGQTVYVAGNFTSIGGVARSRVARVRISDGAVVAAFNAGNITGQIRDMALVDGRLWIGGAFTHVGGGAQRALATLNPTTGARTTYMTRVLAGNHNDGNTQVLKFDLSPDGDRLVAVGNFDTLDGVTNHQLLVLDTSGAAATPADFRTSFYTAACSQSFDTYMRDIDFAPSGDFFVVSTTGAYGGSNGPCDTTARFETAATGTNVQPSWVNYTGGDTTYGVEVTDSVVYVGGHFRWQNNAFRGDAAGQGAVAREGIAALDPLNGLPYSWNPGRTKGVGVFDFLHTPDGLWVASDTDRIGNWQLKSRIARMRPDGVAFPAVVTPQLPNDVYAVGSSGNVPDPSVLHRVNAGGPQIDVPVGPSWAADTNTSPSPRHNAGQNRASYSPVGSVDATVPAGTPSAIFDDELWDPDTAPEQQWDFPVAAGTPIKVRLYFANRCDCTAAAGQRRFHVDLDGVRVLNAFDVTAAVGHNRGTMREFTVTSDGNVDIDLAHVVENPMISGLEIVRTDIPGAAPGAITKRPMTTSSVGAAQTVPSGAIDWSSVRGSFMLNGWLYLANSDGSFVRRSFNGTSYGAAQSVDASEQVVAFTDWRSDVAAMTGVFYDSGRLYVTRTGSNQLFDRYFTAESGVVGAKRLVASGNVAGIDFAQVRGMFGTGSRLYWATPDGNLRSINWAQGAQSGAPVAGTAAVVSGPGTDGVSWSGRAYFLFQDASGSGSGPNQPPVASFTVSCANLVCSFNASGSNDPDGSIASYAWNFGDGQTGSGASTTHTYAAGTPVTVTLTVTDDDGASNQTTRSATPNGEPSAAFTVSCSGLTCSFDASGSNDPDGSIASYAWNFGDGTTGSGVAPQHAYAAPGAVTVTLTVTDGAGATSTTTRTAEPVQPDEPPDADVAFVGSAASNANAATQRVTVPAGVQAGDTLVLHIAVNTTAPTVTGPAGWTQLRQVSDSNVQGRLWTRTATAADAGSSVAVTLSSVAKADLTVSAYRAVGGTTAVLDSGVSVNTATATNHRAPDVTAAAGSWVLTHWSAKASVPVGWAAPAGTTQRATTVGAGGGGIFGLTVDSGSPVNAGNVAGLTAVSDPSVTRVVMFTVVIGLG